MIPDDALPGSHIIVTDDFIAGRKLGLELRDTILVMGAEGTTLMGIFRVKIAEQTVAEQMIRTGTGGIHIDACRVSHTETAQKWSNPTSNKFTGVYNGGKPGHYRRGPELAGPNLAGRWPPNLLFVHTPRCEMIGIKRVRTEMAREGKAQEPNRVYQDGFGRRPGTFGHGDEEGLETVPSWACEDGCPVAELDGQSGDRPGMPLQTARRGDAQKGYLGGWRADPESQGWGDSGSASRFYPQFVDDAGVTEWLARLMPPPAGGPESTEPRSADPESTPIP